jgi:hypothetical protein
MIFHGLKIKKPPIIIVIEGKVWKSFVLPMEALYIKYLLTLPSTITPTKLYQ